MAESPEARRERQRRWRNKNLERCLEQERAYRVRPDVQAKRKAYLARADVQTSRKAYRKKYYAKNKEKFLSYQRSPVAKARKSAAYKKWSRRPEVLARRRELDRIRRNQPGEREKQRKYFRQHYLRNREKCIARASANYKENREKKLAQRRAAYAMKRAAKIAEQRALAARLATSFNRAFANLRELGLAKDTRKDRDILASQVLRAARRGEQDIPTIARIAANKFCRRRGKPEIKKLLQTAA